MLTNYQTRSAQFDAENGLYLFALTVPVERLRIGRPLMAVQWFALQGCDAEKELSAAESLIRGYGEAPQRTQILDALARLHRKL